MAQDTINKRGIIKRILSGAVDKMMSGADKNIHALLRKYDISEAGGYGGKNYDTIFKHTSKLFDKGRAEEARNYLKQQRAGIKGTKIL